MMKLNVEWYEKSHSAEGLKTLNWDANSLKDSWFSHVYWVLGKLSLGITSLAAFTNSLVKAGRVFDNWNLNSKPNEKIMLKGESGCGKSTLLKLLLRFCDYQDGCITVNGIDLKQYPVRQIRDMITYIPQDCYLFEGTISENIAYGSKTEVSMEDIQRVAQLAFADEFIVQFPDKYDTFITSGGTNLSGGQRQRIAIARAFLKDSPILVMDEPSSALDAESELMVHNALKELMKDRLVIMVSHRDNGESDFDRVVAL